MLTPLHSPVIGFTSPTINFTFNYMFRNLHMLVIPPISWRGEYNIDSINTHSVSSVELARPTKADN